MKIVGTANVQTIEMDHVCGIRVDIACIETLYLLKKALVFPDQKELWLGENSDI